jgi:hypothetical protein
MDLQRRISRLLAITGTALLIGGVVAGAFIGGAGAAARSQPGHPEDHPGTTVTTADDTTSTTGKKKSSSSTTTTMERTQRDSASATTGPSAPSTTTSAPTATTTTSGTAAQDQSQSRDQGPGPDQGGSESQGRHPDQTTSAAQVGPTTSSTLNDTVSRGPKSPVVPPGQPPAAPVTSTTVSNPVPPAPVANPLPRTPVTALSGPAPNPVTLDAVQEAPPVGPPLPPWETETPAESENPRPAAGSVAETPTRRPSGQLSMTGSHTRTLLFLAGVALLLGAVAVALGEPGPLRTARVAASARPKARTRKLRRTIPGWESGVPLAPTRRAAKRARLERRGNLPFSYPGDAPGA